MAEDSETGGIVLRYYESYKDEQETGMAKFRALWDEIFDDPPEFADYYYRDVCKYNKILGAYMGDELVGMIHLNPYRIYMDGVITDSYYIVGVAVKENMRRRGIMRLMMYHVIEDMREWGCPFTFLMPKQKVYYTSFGFQTIYETCVMQFKMDGDRCPEIPNLRKKMYPELLPDMIDISVLSPKEMECLAGYINGQLSEQYSFFSERSETYLRNMLAEHHCQHGGVSLLGKKQHLCLFSYDIYGDKMYVERFELLVYSVSSEEIGYMIYQILMLAKKLHCNSCFITVPVSVADKVEMLWESDTRAEELECVPGYGIMALSLSTETFYVDRMKKTSFFDEIV